MLLQISCVLSLYWSPPAIIIRLICLFIRWKDSIIYILPTHSHIGYSNTSHAWLASLLTCISFLTESALSVQLLPLMMPQSTPLCHCALRKLYLSSDQANPSPEVSSQCSCAPDCGPRLSDKTTSPIQGQDTLATVCGALKCDTDAEAKISIVQTQRRKATSIINCNNQSTPRAIHILWLFFLLVAA